MIVESYTRVGVVVTFLRMDQPPADAAPALPEGASVQLLRKCSVTEYRTLYKAVGDGYLWWLRRAMPDHKLSALLQDPRVGVHLLTLDDRPAGFYELDIGVWPVVNLSYFGLMPHAVGTGLGYAFLRHAIDGAWRSGARAITVNTCTADHPRALPTYLRAGFRPIREIREDWNVPDRLGMAIPAHLRV
jgi:GNAT superfamily N-acetyltransferase